MTKELRIAELDVIWALEAIMEFFSGSAAFRGTGRDYTRPRRSSEAPSPFAWWPSVESGAFMLHGVWIPFSTQNTMLAGLRDVHRPVHCSLLAVLLRKTVAEFLLLWVVQTGTFRVRQDA
jgi:hypothetical protein